MFALEACINPSNQMDRDPPTIRAQSSRRNCLRVVTSSLHKSYIKSVGEIKKNHKKSESNSNILPIYDMGLQNS